MNIHFIISQSKNLQIMTSEKEKSKNTLLTADENEKNHRFNSEIIFMYRNNW